MRRKLLCSLLVFSLFLITSSASSSPYGGYQQRSMEKIMTDPEIWGKDFHTLVANLEAFSRAGDAKISIFPEEVVLPTQYKSRDEAQSAAKRVDQSVKDLKANPTPLYRKYAGQSAADLKARVVPYFAEDESIRVAVGPLQLLRPGLTVATVRKQLGAPQKVETLLVQTEGEQRPLILTLYVYAGGSLVFAEADIAPRPGLVNRVIIDVAALTSALK